ncbi:MAG: response regulator [Pseudomonadota bacterium]
MNQIESILLIDDNDADNFIHQLAIEDAGCCKHVDVATSGQAALNYLLDDSNPHPDLIFLDINMPGMTGWEFLDKYEAQQKADHRHVIVMLTTSLNPAEEARAEQHRTIRKLYSKPLTSDIVREAVRLLAN